MAKAKSTRFTVIIPTYTGEEYLPKCFDSVLKQNVKKNGMQFDVVVVIDGPNDRIRGVTQAYEKKFKAAGIEFKVCQLPTNQGRFQARLKGASLAKENHLLFIDDRVTFDPGYFSNVIAEDKGLLIPNVQEVAAKNPANRCLYLLRRRIYGKNKFGASFKSFYIDKNNFEKSPKGTTSLWISKKDFLEACASLSQDTGDNRHVNDDTKLFRYFIDQNRRIYKSSRAIIYYNPRSSAWQETVHIYERGPRFVDYYLRPGTRFFWPLILTIFFCLIALALIIWNSALVLWLAGLLILADIVITLITAERSGDLILCLFYPVIVLAFGLGVAKGLIRKTVL